MLSLKDYFLYRAYRIHCKLAEPYIIDIWILVSLVALKHLIFILMNGRI